MACVERDGAFASVLAFGPEQQPAEGRAEHGLGDDHDRGGVAMGGCASGTDDDQNGVGGPGNGGGHLLRGVLWYGSISRSGKRVVMECGWVGESRTRGRLANISTGRVHLKETHTRG